jgi:hypothetical protein
LALLCGPNPPPYEKVLEDWYLERKQQFERPLAKTLLNTTLINKKGALKIVVRDWALWGIKLLPGWLRPKMKKVLTRYRKSGTGLPFLEEMGGGKMIPQVFCTRDNGQDVRFADVIIFENKELFRLVVLVDGFEEVEDTAEELVSLGGGEGVVCIDEATYFVCSAEALLEKVGNVYQIVQGEEFEEENRRK